MYRKFHSEVTRKNKLTRNLCVGSEGQVCLHLSMCLDEQIVLYLAASSVPLEIDPRRRELLESRMEARYMDRVRKHFFM